MAGRMSARALWFQVHKWLGLALVVLLIPLSLSGALLVWPDLTDSLVNPQRYAVTGGVAKLVSAYAEAARGVLSPGDAITSIRLPEGKGPVVVSAAPPRKQGRDSPRRAGPPQRISIWLDPATARVLDKDDGKSIGFTRFVHQLHGSLLVPGIGRKIVGWLGWAMFASCLTGIWLWWPTVGNAVRGFRWKRQSTANANLHFMVGIWIVVPLAVLSFTGAYISFPDFFRGLEGGARTEQRGPGGPGRRGARPLEATALTVDAAIAAAKLPAASVLSVRYPTRPDPKWAISGAHDALVSVDDATGAIVAGDGPRPSGLARTMRELHDGHDYNIVWQIIVFLGGVAPAILGVTGVIMWLRTRGWRAKLAARR